MPPARPSSATAITSGPGSSAVQLGVECVISRSKAENQVVGEVVKRRRGMGRSSSPSRGGVVRHGSEHGEARSLVEPARAARPGEGISIPVKPRRARLVTPSNAG